MTGKKERLKKFQSTLPRRERREEEKRREVFGTISIHAPAKGATAHTHAETKRIIISIHAPAKGATGQVAVQAGAVGDFNPRSREGSDGYHYG